MKEKELLDSKWQQIEDHEIDESLFEESLEVLNSIYTRKADVINWEEKAEMARLAEGRSTTNESAEAYGKKFSSNTKKEDELMNSLSGIMDIWEREDGKK